MAHNGTPGKKFSLALALATGSSVTAAAEQVGIGRRTAQRRLKDPTFRRLVARLRAQMFGEALGRIANDMSRAASTAAALLDDADPAIRLRAARTMLSLGLRLHDAVDVSDRLHDVEEELARKQAAFE